MRIKLITLVYVALVLVLSACAGQDNSARTSDSTTGSEAVSNTAEDIKSETLPSIALPQISVDDSRKNNNASWLVDIPEEEDCVYQVSSDNDVWVTFSFNEQMNKTDVLAHLVVEPATKITTDWSDRGYRHSLRVRVSPSTVNSLEIGLRAGAKNINGTRALSKDIMVTLERFPAPSVVMHLPQYPSLKMKEYGFYWASPKDAEVIMEFTKPIDKESLAQALTKMEEQKKCKLTWLNEKKAMLKFIPPSGEPTTYDLVFEGVKDEDGVLVSFPFHSLKVTPDVQVKALNLATEKQTEIISVSGGYEGGVVSPGGSSAVFWELGCGVGDAFVYRYWLHDFTSGDKVFLTESGSSSVKWFSKGDRVQVGNKIFSAQGENLKNPFKKKHIIGFDIGPDDRLAYVSWDEQEKKKPNVDLFYRWDGEWQIIESFSYQLFNSNGFFLPMDPSYDPFGKKLAVVKNTAGDAQMGTADVILLDLKTKEESLLKEHALNVFWSPHGDYLAVGKVGGGIEILTPTGDLILELPDHRYWDIVGWTPAGQYLILKKQEETKWITQLIEAKNGNKIEFPGIPLGIDSDGLVYLISE